MDIYPLGYGIKEKYRNPVMLSGTPNRALCPADARNTVAKFEHGMVGPPDDILEPFASYWPGFSFTSIHSHLDLSTDILSV